MSGRASRVVVVKPGPLALNIPKRLVLVGTRVAFVGLRCAANDHGAPANHPKSLDRRAESQDSNCPAAQATLTFLLLTDTHTHIAARGMPRVGAFELPPTTSCRSPVLDHRLHPRSDQLLRTLPPPTAHRSRHLQSRPTQPLDFDSAKLPSTSIFCSIPIGIELPTAGEQPHHRR